MNIINVSLTILGIYLFSIVFTFLCAAFFDGSKLKRVQRGPEYYGPVACTPIVNTIVGFILFTKLVYIMIKYFLTNGVTPIINAWKD